MITKTEKDLDIILISGEYYDDHPLSPVGVIAKVIVLGSSKNQRKPSTSPS
jgi:hypothetical protein